MTTPTPTDAELDTLRELAQTTKRWWPDIDIKNYLNTLRPDIVVALLDSIAALRADRDSWEQQADDRANDVLRIADRAEADNAALREQVAAWLQVWDNVHIDIPNLREDNKPLAVAASYALLKIRADKAEADNVALREDAERYRWLRMQGKDQEALVAGMSADDGFRGQLLDVYIDAALLTGENQPKEKA